MPTSPAPVAPFLPVLFRLLQRPVKLADTSPSSHSPLLPRLEHENVQSIDRSITFTRLNSVDSPRRNEAVSRSHCACCLGESLSSICLQQETKSKHSLFHFLKHHQLQLQHRGKTWPTPSNSTAAPSKAAANSFASPSASPPSPESP